MNRADDNLTTTVTSPPRQAAAVSRHTPELVALRSDRSTAAEQLRAVATRLMSGMHAERARTLALVSCHAGDGRSFAAANLAAMLAQAGRRTVLIDADLHRPRLHQIFGLAAHPGVEQWIADPSDESALQAVPGLVWLQLIAADASTAGAGRTAAMMRERFIDGLDQLRRRFDQIVIDTAASASYADGHAIAAQAGAAIIVCRRDQTRIDEVNRLKAELESVGVDVLGVILNRP